MLRVDWAGLAPEIPMRRENGAIIGPEEEWPVKRSHLAGSWSMRG